jgi:HAD superfamily hydrolase (TIGR01490 family)
MESKTAAFFDLDNTLIKGAALFHLGKGLIKHKEINKKEIRVFARAQIKFRATNKEPGLNKLAQKALEILANREANKIELLSKKIVDDFLPYAIHPGALELLRIAKEKYDEVWILTAAPEPLALIISEKLGLTGAIGTKLGVKDGFYTGKIINGFHHGVAKRDSVIEIAKLHGIKLEKCASYSDSFNDLPLLKITGEAHAVNPDRKLRAYAKKNYWSIRELSNRYRNLYVLSFLIYTAVILLLSLKFF